MGEEADPGVEGDPAQDEVECVFNDGEGGEHHEVNEPWCEEGGIGCVEGFVGREDGEEDGGCYAAWWLASRETCSCMKLCFLATASLCVHYVLQLVVVLNAGAG